MLQKELHAKMNRNRLSENTREVLKMEKAERIGQEEETLFDIIQGSIQTLATDKGRATL